MKYQTDITGMHCTGCQNLIKVSLEDESLSDVKVSLDDHKAKFSSDISQLEIEQILIKVFSELKEYQYQNLRAV